MKEELIRDRLVVGILDSGLSEKLQLDSNLDLEKAKKAIRLKEAVQESQRALRQAGDSKDNPVKLDAVGTTPRNAASTEEAVQKSSRSGKAFGALVAEVIPIH